MQFNPKMVIKSLKDIEDVASSYLGKCRVFVDPVTKGFGERVDGKRIINLVVGYKMNPSFDINANPESTNPTERKKANPRIADVRIIAIQPRITVKELIETELLKIKKSMEKKDKTIDETISSIAPQRNQDKIQPVDPDKLAEDMMSGKDSNTEFETEDSGWEDENIGGVDQEVSADYEPAMPANGKDSENADSGDDPAPAEESSKSDQIIDALNSINENQQTLADSFNKLETKVVNLEKKIRKSKKNNKKSATDSNNKNVPNL